MDIKKGQWVLDTLFIKLTNPPSDVKINDLPTNVVSFSKTTTSMYCTLPDDSQIYLARSQVEVLPCFAMTDYAFQGKTRPFNPVDIMNL
jgi:hypothetical protein